MVPFIEYANYSDERMCEWVDGAVAELPLLSEAQVRVRDMLLSGLGSHIEGNEMGLLIAAPFAVRMPEEMGCAREPDLLYVPNQFADTVQSNYVNSHGVALVIEITDGRTRQQDYDRKFADYQMAGISEYWIIDVERKHADFYQLRQLLYEHTPTGTTAYVSPVLLGYSLSLGSLFEHSI